MRMLWHPARASGGLRSSASRDLEEMADAVDIHTAEVCDTVIGDLPRDEHMAIHARYLRTAYTCADYAGALERATRAVGIGLAKRGVIYP